LKLLVELRGSSLVKLALLFEKGVIGSLMKIRSPLEQKDGSALGELAC
jgi:hypothetical protein